MSSEIRNALRGRVGGKRFRHVMGVEGLSVVLARKWGVDPEKAMLAALLHDMAKDFPEDEQKRLMLAGDDFTPSAEDMEFPAMWHGLAAAHLGKTEFGIDDRDILEAAAWHTTGIAGLGEVGLCLFVADYLEPTRHFDGVTEARGEILQLPQRQAAATVAARKLTGLGPRKQRVHSRTQAMKDWLHDETQPS